MNTRSKRKVPDSILPQSKKPIKKRKAVGIPIQHNVSNINKLFNDPNSLISLIGKIDNEKDRLNFFNSNFKVRREIKDIIERYYDISVMKSAIAKFLSRNNINVLFKYINHFWPTNFFVIIFSNPNFYNVMKNAEYVYAGILTKIFSNRTPLEPNVDHLLFIAFPELQLTGLHNFLSVTEKSWQERRNDNEFAFIKFLKPLSIAEIHSRLTNILDQHEMNIFEIELLKMSIHSTPRLFLIWNLIASEIMKNFNEYYSSLSPKDRFLLIQSYITVM